MVIYFVRSDESEHKFMLEVCSDSEDLFYAEFVDFENLIPHPQNYIWSFSSFFAAQLFVVEMGYPLMWKVEQ